MHSSQPQKPILVTGIPRSGTTWVGRMLHASGETTYVAEPLNIWRRPRPFRSRTDGWPGYPYVTARNEETYLPVLSDIVELRMAPLRELRAVRSGEDLAAVLSTLATFLIGRILGRRALLKEPHAFFLALWFAERFAGQVVMTVRHPAAVVSSWKRLEWPVDLDQLLTQDLLLQEWLGPYAAEIVALRSSGETISQAALLWKIVYDYVDRARRTSPALHVVRHEDLSAHPVEGFRALYEALDLTFSSRAEQTVRSASSAGNPKEVAIEQPYAVRLDSEANLGNWRGRLTPDEIRRVRDITGEVARIYYSDESWGA